MKNLRLICLLFLSLLFTLSSYAQTEIKTVENISSKFLEFAPTLSGDGRVMVFQQMRKDRWYLYESHLSPSGSWSEPAPLASLNNRFRYISGPCLSYDGKLLLFTAYDESGGEDVSSEDIYFCKKINGAWGEPENIGKPINSFMYEGYPSLSPDGNTLYFMRENTDYPFDKDAKVHCFTLFSSKRNHNGQWQEPEELPYPVNFNCERSPKMLVDGKTLMFSSLRANSRGGFDIYQSRLQPNGMWTEPQPVEYINTKNNDQSPCVAPGGDKIYYYCDGDILEATIPEERREYDAITLYGRVIDAVYELGLSVTLEIVDQYSGDMIAQFDNTESDGKFSLDLRKGMVYAINVIQDNNFTYTFPLDLTEIRKEDYIERDFELFSNLNLKIDMIDQKTQQPIPGDQRVMIRMDKTRREEIYLLKFNVKNYSEASTFLDLNEVRKNPDFRKKIELASIF